MQTWSTSSKTFTKTTVVLFLCRDGSGSKWPPLLKVWGKLYDDCNKVRWNCLRLEGFYNLFSKMSQEFFYPIQKLKKTNMKFWLCYPSFLRSCYFSDSHNAQLNNHKPHMNTLNVKWMLRCYFWVRVACESRLLSYDTEHVS